MISAVLLRTGDCLFVSGLRIKTTPALVVFTAKGVALSVCEPACATRNKPYKASDRHAVCECIARTYQARAGASFFFTHRLVGVFLLISAVFLRTGDCLFVSGLRIKTPPALVVFTAKGIAFFICLFL